MTTEHPITPPPELLQHWATEYWGNPGESIGEGERYIAIQAARWGSDQELEACCEWLSQFNYDDYGYGDRLRAARRRPKPPSLKWEALALVEQHEDGCRPSPKDWDIIRLALESLPN